MAAAWYAKAADQEHAAAQAYLGGCYALGAGVEQSYALAVMWYRRAAEQNSAVGQCCLGNCYAYGEGMDQDDALAVAWWEKAAKGGDEDAQYRLGRCYTDGTCGLPKNARCAKIFMKAAAEQGLAEAIEALKLLRACAACGAPDARKNCMGCLSCTGLAVVRYCTPECQEKHWKRHKRDCGGLKACACRRCVSERGDSGASAAAT